MQYRSGTVKLQTVHDISAMLGLNPAEITSITITSTMVTAWKYNPTDPGLRDLVAILVIDPEDQDGERVEEQEEEEYTPEEINKVIDEGEPVEFGDRQEAQRGPTDEEFEAVRQVVDGNREATQGGLEHGDNGVQEVRGEGVPAPTGVRRPRSGPTAF